MQSGLIYLSIFLCERYDIWRTLGLMQIQHIAQRGFDGALQMRCVVAIGVDGVLSVGARSARV